MTKNIPPTKALPSNPHLVEIGVGARQPCCHNPEHCSVSVSRQLPLHHPHPGYLLQESQESKTWQISKQVWLAKLHLSCCDWHLPPLSSHQVQPGISLQGSQYLFRPQLRQVCERRHPPVKAESTHFPVLLHHPQPSVFKQEVQSLPLLEQYPWQVSLADVPLAQALRAVWQFLPDVREGVSHQPQPRASLQEGQSELTSQGQVVVLLYPGTPLLQFWFRFTHFSSWRHHWQFEPWLH